jgi:hypothetical protein
MSSRPVIILKVGIQISLENGQLSPQGKVLKRQVASFFEVGSEESRQEKQETFHGPESLTIRRGSQQNQSHT